MEYGIYRKPTRAELVIRNESNHPFQYKMASFRSMVHRLLTYELSKSEFDKEKNIIKRVAYNNGYDPSIIDNLIRKTKYKLLHSPKTGENKDQKYIPLKYNGKNSQIIGNVFKENSYYPGYKINKSFSLNKQRGSHSIENTKGVYLIECNGGA